MKESTAKQPVQPIIDHSQGKSLFAKLFERLFSSNSPLVQKFTASRHADQKRCQNSTNFIRKIQAKKKRKRKISYQSRRNNHLVNRKKIRI